MGQKIILFIAILLTNINAFSQNEESVKRNRKIAIELSAGKIFSPYRFYINHTGYENVLLGISNDLSPKYGILFSQSYGRIYSENTNNRTLVMATTVNAYIKFFRNKKINLQIAAGTGLLYLYTKCLYDVYPVSESFYGLPVRLNISSGYKLTDKISINLNIDVHYGFLFKSNNYYHLIIDDPYYYKTFFYSLNLGLRYSFGKKEKQPGGETE